MTSRPLENEVGPRRFSEGERAEGDFVRSFTEAPPKCNALVISDPTGHEFTAFCAYHDWYGRERWHGADGKSEAQQEAAWHTREKA